MKEQTQTAAYLTAVVNIQAEIDRKIRDMEVALQSARAKTLAAYRAAPLDGVDPQDPAYPIAVVVSQTIVIGREDGYPSVSCPDSTRELVRAGYNAGIVKDYGHAPMIGKLCFSSGNGITTLPEVDADRNAWVELRDYRNNQTVKSL